MKLQSILRYTSLFGALTVWVSFLPAQEATPPEAHIIGQVGDNKEGSQENPFVGSGIALTMIIEDETPTSYESGGWQVYPAGSFCPGPYQFFGTELLTPSLKHPRVRSGVARIRVTAILVEPPFDQITAEGTFYVAEHPEGCGNSDAPPSDLSLQVPTSALPGQTISLLASATDASDSSLTFFFYVGSTSQASGSLIGERTSSGCQDGCSTSMPFLVDDHPTTHFFRFEVSDDGERRVISDSRAVQVSSQGGDGEPAPPGSPAPSPVVCQGCNSTVDAGPASAIVVGGESLSLAGQATGPQLPGGGVAAGSAGWVVVDDGGLGSDLRILNFTSPNATLLTPDVSQDMTVRIGYQANFNGCGCTDEIEVTLLADPLPEADLSLTQSAAEFMEADEELVYTLEVKNNGPDRANNVILTDFLPLGATLMAVSPSKGSCETVESVVNCAFGGLVRGLKASATIRIRPNKVGTLVNNASVKSDERDPRPHDNESQSVTVVLDRSVDLSLSKRSLSSQARVGEEIIYEIEVRNQGDAAASQVVVNDTLPDGLQFVEASSGAGCVLQSSANRVRCELGTLQAGSQVTLQIKTRATAAGELVNTATVGAAEEDSQTSNNESSATTRVDPRLADLHVSVSAQEDSVRKGSDLGFTIEVQNQGPVQVGGVLMTSNFPEQYTATSVSTSHGSCESSDQQIVCQLGALAVDELATVEVAGLASSAGSLMHSVQVSGDEEDPDPSNNSASFEVKVDELSFSMVPHSLGMESTFVSMAVVNLFGGPNAVEIQGVNRQGLETALMELESPAALGQSAFLTNEVIGSADTLIARGQRGPIQTFFMLGDFEQAQLDGIGGVMPDSEKLYFPLAQRASARGTVFFLFNPSLDKEAHLEANLFRSDGELAETATLSLSPLGSFRGQLEELFGDVELAEGYVELTSSVKLRGFELSIDHESRNFAAVTAQPGLQTRRLMVPHFVVFPNTTTVLRLLNLDSQDAQGTINLFNDSGSLLAEASISISPGKLGRFDLREVFDFDALQADEGYLEVRLSGGTVGVFERSAHLVATVSYEGPQFHAALPMADAGRRETLFLHVAQSQEHGIFHGLAVLNPSGDPAQCTVQVFDKEGNQSGQAAFELLAGERIVDLLDGGAFFGAGFSQVLGHLRVTSSKPVIAFALFGGASYLAAIEGQGMED